MICSNCKRRLRNDATSCICGKFGAQSQIRAAHIQCCFEGCKNSANVRMFTKTGWVNVCARVDRTDAVNEYHYEKIERVNRRANTIVMDEYREAYAKARGRGIVVLGAVKTFLPREPGSDDDFESRMADRMEP